MLQQLNRFAIYRHKGVTFTRQFLSKLQLAACLLLISGDMNFSDFCRARLECQPTELSRLLAELRGWVAVLLPKDGLIIRCYS